MKEIIEGSIVEMTDSSGNAVNSYGYDPLSNINGSQEQAGSKNQAHSYLNRPIQRHWMR